MILQNKYIWSWGFLGMCLYVCQVSWGHCIWKDISSQGFWCSDVVRSCIPALSRAANLDKRSVIWSKKKKWKETTQCGCLFSSECLTDRVMHWTSLNDDDLRQVKATFVCMQLIWIQKSKIYSSDWNDNRIICTKISCHNVDAQSTPAVML